MLKTTYPALITPTERGFRIEVPQFDITVEAEAAADGIQMARNQICTMLLSCVDTRGELPAAEPLAALAAGYTTTLIDVDMGSYMLQYSTKSVHKNVSIPAWLDTEAKKKRINLSQTLQNALLTCLGHKSTL